MEISSGLSLFTEILISGVLFAIGIWPLLSAFFPGVTRLSEWKEWKPWVLGLVAIVYVLGVGGNRLVEAGFKEVSLDPAEGLQRAEFVIRTEGEEAGRAWIDRHKSYLKILRAASTSALLLLASMAVHRWWVSKGQPYARSHKYFRRHFVGVTIAFAVFFAAYRFEVSHYKKHIPIFCEVLHKSHECFSPDLPGEPR